VLVGDRSVDGADVDGLRAKHLVSDLRRAARSAVIVPCRSALRSSEGSDSAVLGFASVCTDDDVRVPTRQSQSAKKIPSLLFASVFRSCLRVISEHHAGSAKILSRNRENLIGGIERSERNRRWVRALCCDADPGGVNLGKGRVHVGNGAFHRVV
jgi:hypothetical protein